MLEDRRDGRSTIGGPPQPYTATSSLQKHLLPLRNTQAMPEGSMDYARCSKCGLWLPENSNHKTILLEREAVEREAVRLRLDAGRLCSL